MGGGPTRGCCSGLGQVSIVREIQTPRGEFKVRCQGNFISCERRISGIFRSGIGTLIGM